VQRGVAQSASWVTLEHRLICELEPLVKL